MREESVNTADGTTGLATDATSLPVPLEPAIKRQPSHLPNSRGRTTRKRTSALPGLACLESVDYISVELDRNCLSCQLDKNYTVRDIAGDKVLFTGVQDFNAFNFDNLKNVIISSPETSLPIARVSFKQKSSLYSSMALGVYCPCDRLAGTGEEISGLLMFTSKLLIRNSDGDEIFHIEYTNNIFSSSYQIKSAKVNDDGGDELIAKVVEKTRHRVRLQLISKMSVTSKIMLVGFGIAVINKFTPPNKPIE